MDDNARALPATKGDIEDLRSATKADIEDFRNATKGDIEALREDLKELVRDSQTEVLRAFYNFSKAWKFVCECRTQPPPVSGNG